MAGSRAKLSVDAAAFVPDFIQASAPASAVSGPLDVDAMVAIEREMLSVTLRNAVVASMQEQHGTTASFILVSSLRCRECLGPVIGRLAPRSGSAHQAN